MGTLKKERRTEDDLAATGIAADLDYYQGILTSLARHRGRGPGGAAPHKPCLLLAVLDMIERGVITDGRISYGQVLKSFFPDYFSLATGIKPGSAEWRRKYRPFDPFWHLNNERANFWRLCARPGREEEFEAMPRSGGKTHKQVLRNVAYAELDTRFFTLLQDPGNRAEIRKAILDKYFPGTSLEDFRHLVHSSPLMKRRDPKFRETVIEAYGGKCAATGEVIATPSGAGSKFEIVEAAHLHPFFLSFNNDPRNGMALQPTYHTAMDKSLIAPGTDGKWHVSQTIRDSGSQLCDLDGERIFLPKDKAMHPRKYGLEWRMKDLLE